VPIPFLIAAGLAAAAGAGSAISGAVGSENARAAQESAAEKAMRLQREMWETQQANQAPWLNAGRTTLADLVQQMQSGSFNTNVDPSQLANDPGFQFRMAEGQKALERSASARGMLNSGGAMKSLSRYSQGLASNEYQNAWNRNQTDNTNRFDRLANLAGVGQQAANNLGAMGGQYANNMSDLYGAVGNAQAAGAMGAANAVSGGFSTLGNLAMMGGMSGGGGGGQQIPTQYGYQGGGPSYGQSTMGYQTQGFGPWR
jgi:hypothetical protein